MTEENNYQENNTVEHAKEELRQEVPEIITTEVNVEGLKDLDHLVEEMEKIDAAQLEDKGKMFALDVSFNGKRSNPYFTLCKFIQELNNKIENN